MFANGPGAVRGYSHQPATPYPHPAFSRPVVPDSDPVPTVGRGTGAVIPTNLPPLTHIRHSRDPSCRTPIRYPRWGAGRARLSPPTCRPLPTSGIPPNRLPRRRSGTQGRAATPTTPLHNHTRTPANHVCRGASCGHPPGWTGGAATTHSTQNPRHQTFDNARTLVLISISSRALRRVHHSHSDRTATGTNCCSHRG